MKQITLFVLLFFTCSFLCFSQWEQTNGPSGGYTNEIVEVGSTLFLSAGSAGMYRSIDNGESWQSNNIGTLTSPLIVGLIAHNEILYVSVLGKGVYKSIDAGENWVSLDLTNVLEGDILLFANGMNVYFANSRGDIYYSNDEGLSLLFLANSISGVTFKEFAIFDSKVYAAGFFLYELSEDGTTWVKIDIPGFGLNGIRSMTATENVFYVGDDGYIFISKDGLNTWEKSTPFSSISSTVTSITNYENRVYAGTGLGRYFYTEDNGVNWTLVQNSMTKNFIRHLYVSDDMVIMSTEEGLFKSDDFGAVWSSNSTGINGHRIISMYANDESIYAGTSSQGIYISKDNGNLWKKITNGLNNLNSNTIHEIIEVENILYIATGAGIYKSLDGGDNWQENFIPGINSGGPGALAYDNNIFVAGPAEEGKGIYISTDKAATWNVYPIDILSKSTIFQSILIKNNIIIIATAGGEILFSDDLGVSWSNRSISSDLFVNTNEIKLVNDKLYAATFRGVFVSDDLGQNWELVNSSSFGGGVNDLIISSDIIYAATRQGLYITSESNPEWYPIDEALSIIKIFIKDGEIFAGTFNRSVWKQALEKISLPEIEIEKPFITTWKTDNPGVSADNQITIPTFPGETYNYTVDWGDETSDTGVTGDITHTYATPGTYPVSITGDFPRIFFNGNFVFKGDEFKILNIEQWGDIQWKSMENAFLYCKNLEITALDSPNLSGVTSLQKMFKDCSFMVGNVSFNDWDVSNILNMSEMFDTAINFNQDIGQWDVANVTDMSNMFFRTLAFKGAIGNWDVGNVKNTSAMFMFSDFNEDIGNWDVSKVTTMRAMFRGAMMFNQDISGWNVGSVTRMTEMFSSASSFNQDIGGWNVSNVTQMGTMFSLATSFNQDIGDWDVSNVTNTFSMFSRASSFDQDLGNWDISSMTIMAGIFFEVSLSVQNYDRILTGWSTLDANEIRIPRGVFLDILNTQYCLGAEARQKLIDDYGWTITDGGENCTVTQRPFITTWKTDNPGVSEDNQITIPISPFSQEVYNYFVDWGDGTSDSGVNGSIVHTYEVPGTYQVSISGDFPSIMFNSFIGNTENSDSYKILTIEQWGDISWQSMSSSFGGCVNLDMVAVDTPNLSKIESLFSMFANCNSLVGNESFNNWDLSSVTNIIQLFSQCHNFNQDISSWDVSNVTSLNSLFTDCFVFDQDISSWDVSNVETMAATFRGAVNFNQDIGNWDVSNVIDMSGMFQTPSSQVSKFNQDISDWDVSSVADMTLMFSRASNFNQDIGNWNVSNVTDMAAMFQSAKVFDQDISNWDVSSVMDMKFMFNGAVNFNQDIGNWDVSNVISMRVMLRNTKVFNQDISNWDVSSVTSMIRMFNGASNFNQDIGNWNVSNVTDMTGMFNEATSFDQDISNWDVSSVTDMSEMFNNTALSTENYDSLLQGWSSLPSLQNEVDFDAGNSKYCLSSDVRQSLIDTYSWVINDGGQDCSEALLVTSFVLVDADTDEDLFTITEGMVIDIASLPTTNLTIRAETTELVESVGMELTGALTNTRTENVLPYALFGDQSGNDYAGMTFSTGEYIISADSFSENSLGGEQGIGLTVNFELVGTASEIAITSFVLVDADTDMDLFELTDGMTIDITSLPTTNLSVRTETTEGVNSIAIELSGALINIKTENVIPYSLFGDMPGNDYIGMTFLAGEYSISAQSFSGKSLSGTQGDGLEVNFEFVEAIAQEIAVTNFMLIDADTNRDLFIITNGAVIDINSLPSRNLSVRAETTELTESVSMEITGAKTIVKAESALPYALFGDLPGNNYIGMTFPIGGYALTAESFSENGQKGTQGASLTVNFEFVGVIQETGVSSFVLVDADTNKDLFTITDGMTIDIASLPTTNLSIRTETTEGVNSVALELTGAVNNIRTENIIPYALFGDLPGNNYIGMTFPIGSYSFTADPFSGKSLSGDQGIGLTVDFSITGTASLRSSKDLGFGQPSLSNNMSMYPNPASETITASFNTPVELEKVLVFDIHGKLVHTYVGGAIKDGDAYVMDIDYLQPGTYFIITEDNKGSNFQKQIIVK